MPDETLLRVESLTTSFVTDAGKIRAVDDVGLTVQRGKTLALVGESGCGKSVTALSIMRLVPKSNGSIDGGRILLGSKDILSLRNEEMRRVRGNRISMIFQEPMTSLNPVYTVGQQIAEAFRIHRGLSRNDAFAEAIRMLEQVAIPDATRHAGEYPFQLSGGMRQRVMIAMALACEPELLIADEPTTALDVTIQAQILRLMAELQEKRGTSIIFITHDLGVVAEVADEVAIMYAGRIVESGTVFEIFENPRHPYTRGLMDSIPSLDDRSTEPLQIIEGTVPGLAYLPSGCRFHPRCSFADESCSQSIPALKECSPSHTVSCFKHDLMAAYQLRH